MTLLGFKTILHRKCRSGKNSEGPAENSWVLDSMSCGGGHLGFPIGIKKQKLCRGSSNDHSWAVWFQFSEWFQRRTVLKHFSHSRLFEICFHFAGHRSSTQEFSAGLDLATLFLMHGFNFLVYSGW
jgi:hypothetical protein